MLIIKGGKSCLVFTFTYCSSCLKSCKESIQKSIKFLDFSSIKHIYKSLKNFFYQRLQDERFFIRNHLKKKISRNVWAKDKGFLLANYFTLIIHKENVGFMFIIENISLKHSLFLYSLCKGNTYTWIYLMNLPTENMVKIYAFMGQFRFIVACKFWRFALNMRTNFVVWVRSCENTQFVLKNFPICEFIAVF